MAKFVCVFVLAVMAALYDPASAQFGVEADDNLLDDVHDGALWDEPATSEFDSDIYALDFEEAEFDDDEDTLSVSRHAAGTSPICPWYRCSCGCKGGEKMKQAEKPTPNGCGTVNTPASIKKYLNKYFKASCDAHDICYGTCDETRKSCDSKFKAGMLEKCGNKKRCRRLAFDVYAAVRIGGCRAYSKAQKNHCSC